MARCRQGGRCCRGCLALIQCLDPNCKPHRCTGTEHHLAATPSSWLCQKPGMGSIQVPALHKLGCSTPSALLSWRVVVVAVGNPAACLVPARGSQVLAVGSLKVAVGSLKNHLVQHAAMWLLYACWSLAHAAADVAAAQPASLAAVARKVVVMQLTPFCTDCYSGASP